MDVKFSVALHILVMAAESKETLTSEALAKSVNTNPSYIRKITALLKKAEIIDSTQGKSGLSLKVAPEELNLLEIYNAVHPESLKLLYTHANANESCPVGQNIEEVLSPLFEYAELALQNSLKEKNLESIIMQLKEKYNESHIN